MVRSLLAVAVCGLAFSLPLLGSAPRGPGDIIFDYVAASRCGILTSQIERGVRMEFAAATARLGLSPGEARVLRTKGWIAAERKWRDRQGIGAGTACRTDGAAAAARFSAIAAGALAP
jgi:hypothetical protein